ncbi:MAG: hypothetical protein IJW48_01660 [Clostridia bacterium]|nr:hypothetical protein [Clostridia bacterium]
MLIYFTWRRSAPDCYFEFRSGTLSLGIEAGRRRARREKIRIHVKEAERICPAGPGRVKLSGVSRMYDMSSSSSVSERVCIVYDGGRTAVVFDTTPALSRLLVSYSSNADELSAHLNRK